MAKIYAPFKISENISETPEGYLLCKNVPIARTGTMEYGEGETPLETGDDGKVHVERDADEVFDPKTVSSAEGKSITIKHPNDFVNPENWKDLSKGILRNVRRGEEKDEDGNEQLLADLLITDAFAISLVRAGLREVSCGYEAEYEQTGKGKGRQTGIVVNHLALVEEGRAGSSYAINDHKGKETMSKKILNSLKEKIAGLTQVVDEAAKEMKDDQPSPKAEKKAGSETNTVMDKEMYDELVKAVKDLGEKVEGMMGGKKKDSEDEEEEESEDAEENEVEGQILERVKALEAAVAKLLEGKSEDEDKEEDEAEDEEEEGEESEDDSEACDEEEGEEGEKSQKKTGDAARAEILAPGLKVAKKEDLKKMALKAAYKTKEGKEVLDSLTGDKKLTLDSAATVSTLFIAASEILKVKRGTGLEGTKNGIGFESFDSKTEVMTAEKMNELNAAHWARK